MFDKLIERKIGEETQLAGAIQKFTLHDIESSRMSAFTKAFIAAEMPEGGFRADLEDLIDKSVKLNLNFTIRPKWTILHYVFGSFDSKPVEQILSRIGIFKYYRFYEESIRPYVIESGLMVITKKKVSDLIDDANKILYEKLITEPSAVKTKNFFIHLFKLKYEETTDINLDASVPYGFIRIFLEDKEYTEILGKFLTLRKLDDDKEINLKTIIKLINGKYISEEELAEAPKPAEENADKKPDIIDVELEPEIPAEEPEEEPAPAPAPEKKPVKETISLPDSEIFALFKTDKILKILKKIFHNDRNEMFGIISQLEGIRKWDDASPVLKELFEKNNVNLYDRDVLLFVNTINDYFNRKNDN